MLPEFKIETNWFACTVVLGPRKVGRLQPRAETISQWEESIMVEYTIKPTNEGLLVQIYDAPAGGRRILFVERDGQINKYMNRDRALAGIEIYRSADKTALIEAELSVYLDAAQTGKSLGECGLNALVRFSDQDHYPYATFILPEHFIRKTHLKIIGYRGVESIYSAGCE
jgi:hypothetical protein